MRKIELLKKHKEFKKGKVIEVSNNLAHVLIDKGTAIIKVFKSPRNKMMISKNVRKKNA